MYQEHFGLHEIPFSLTPDTSFFFNHPSHRQALNVVMVALRAGEGFVKITGEVGTGKTLLCRKLLNGLQEEFVTAYLPNPLLKPLELYRAVTTELAIDTSPAVPMQKLLELLSENLIELGRQGRQVVLILDEVQAMPTESLEAIRLLSNLETEKRKLLQIVLFAQPELDVRLDQPALRQLRQRICFSCCLDSLESGAVGAYVSHRMLVAGYRQGQLFTPRAIDCLYRASRGIPRLVNMLCHKALLAAYGKGDHVIEPKHIRAAARDSEDASWMFWFPYLGLAIAGACVAIAGELALLGYVLRKWW